MKDIDIGENCDYLNMVELLTPKTEDKILQCIRKDEEE